MENTKLTLEQLNAQYDSIMLNLATEIQKSGARSPESIALKLEGFRVDKLITGEIAEAAKAERDAKIAEARNERVKFVTNYKAAVIAHHIAKTAEAKQQTSDELAKHEEVLTNELLAKHPVSTPSVKKDGTAQKGNKTNEVFALFDAGQTYGQILSAGYADGTIRSAAWKGGYKKTAAGGYSKN